LSGTVVLREKWPVFGRHELTSRPSLRGANVVAVVKAADRAKEMAPAWVALLLTLAYLAIALTG